MTNWDEVARGARGAANELVETRYRSCLNRAYYAVYSKVTHDLVECGVTMPQDMEGPRHPGHLPGGVARDGGIRKLIVTRLTNLTVERREALSDLVGALYTLRLAADYHPSISIDDADAREAVSMMNTAFEDF